MNVKRMRAWRYAHLFAGKTVVIAFGAALIITLLALGLQLLSVASLAGGITLLFLLSFTFAHTYYPSHAPAGKLSFEVIALLEKYRKSSKEDFWQAVLQTNAGAKFIAYMEIPADNFISHAPEISEIIDSLANGPINTEHLIGSALLRPETKTFIRQHDLQEEDIEFAIWRANVNRQQTVYQRRWWDPERLLAFSGLGITWTSGFTPLVDKLARLPVGNLWDSVTPGRSNQMEQLMSTLARERQSNVLLVGQPGVGRLGLVKDLARRARSNKAHPNLNGFRVLYIHAATNVTYLAQALREMQRAGNVIAVIDGISSLLNTKNEEGVSAADLLIPFLSATSVRSIVMVSEEDYHLSIKNNNELAHFFEVVRVPSADSATTLQALSLAAPSLEKKTGIVLPYKTLRALVRQTDGILVDIPYPERAFDVLEEALVVAQAAGINTLSTAEVDALVSRKAGIPVGAIEAEEKDKLLNLEDIMHERLVNQEQAVTAVAKSLVRARTGVRSTNKPIGTFLFLGPTGVGKTETAKTLAHAYFGSTDKMIRFDMSEFQEADGVEILLGDTSGSGVGRLSQVLSKQPFAVLLLDEFEKAHSTVHQLFLQILDEGKITDARGHEVSFRNTIIIATSNAGAGLIYEQAKEGAMTEEFTNKLREHILSNNIFRPELLNRFDGVITFGPLSPEHVQQIARLMLAKLNARLDEQHGVTVAITDELLVALQQTGYNPQFGARPMNRAIQDMVEYTVADMVLRGQTTPGQEIVLEPQLFSG